jgi:microcystin-dependent protein
VDAIGGCGADESLRKFLPTTNIQKTMSALLISGSSLGEATGTIKDWPSNTIPNGWLECGGQAVSRTTFAALFAVIGVTYGVGNGSTTFNLPDLRGRVTAGKDDMGGLIADRLVGGAPEGVDGAMLGAVGGHKVHQLTIGEAPTLNVQSVFQIGSESAVVGYEGPVGGVHNNVQPTIILNKIIKT